MKRSLKIFVLEFWELAKLNLIFLLTMPLLPPALTALHTCTSLIALEEHRYIFSDYLRVYKKAVKKSWASMIFLILILLASIGFVFQARQKNSWTILILATLALCLIYNLWAANFYFSLKGFFLLGRIPEDRAFQDSLIWPIALIKNNILSLVLQALLIFALIEGLYLSLAFILLGLPAWLAYISSASIVRQVFTEVD